jgi:tetratricopeptide (TPR) repeat protein
MNRLLVIFWMSFYCVLSLNAQDQSAVDSLLKVLNSSVSDKVKAGVYFELGSEYNPDDSLKSAQYYNKALDLSKQINFPEGKADAIYGLSALYDRLEYFDKAEFYMKLLIQEESIMNYPERKAIVLKELARNRYSARDLDAALRYAYQSLDANKEAGLESEIPGNYFLVATILGEMGNHQKAFETYFSALELIDVETYPEKASSFYNNIATLYIEQGNFKNALEYGLESLRISEKFQSVNISSDYNNLGYIYFNLNQLDSAYVYYNKAIKYNPDYKRSSYALYYNNLADVFIKQQKLDSAYYYARKSLDLAEEVGFQRVVARSNIALGSYYLETKDYSNSVSYLDKGISIAEEIGRLEEARIGYEKSSRAYIALRDYKKSTEALNALLILKDSINNEEQTRRITRLEAEYE